jgi:hypothetical protein
MLTICLSPISTETLEPTDDIEKNARMKKRIQDQLAKLKRNAERRRQRQLNKNAALAENPVFGLMRGKKEGAIVSTLWSASIPLPKITVTQCLAFSIL